MRSLVAVIFLLAFFCLQYGKLVSYWQCRIRVRCDCEKILANTHTADALSVNTKTEEIVVFYEADEQIVIRPLRVTYTSFYTDHLPNIYTSPIFQPPRM